VGTGRGPILTSHDTGVHVHQSSEYTLSLRIDAKSIDFDTMDRALGVVGTRQHIDRQPTRFGPALDHDQWEVEAEDMGSWFFDSIDDAFSSMAGEFLAPAVGHVATIEGLRAYWWCGCFHGETPALTLISKRTLDLLGRSHSPIYLDTYYSPESDPDESETSFDETPDDVGDELPNHRYRFRLSDGESRLSEGEWGPYYEDFSEGLELEIQKLTTSVQPNGVRAGTIKKVVCEHVQSAFDGGPKLSAAHANAIARLGLDMAILWRTAE